MVFHCNAKYFTVTPLFTFSFSASELWVANFTDGTKNKIKVVYVLEVKLINSYTLPVRIRFINLFTQVSCVLDTTQLTGTM